MSEGTGCPRAHVERAMTPESGERDALGVGRRTTGAAERGRLGPVRRIGVSGQTGSGSADAMRPEPEHPAARSDAAVPAPRTPPQSPASASPLPPPRPTSPSCLRSPTYATPWKPVSAPPRRPR